MNTPSTPVAQVMQGSLAYLRHRPPTPGEANMKRPSLKAAASILIGAIALGAGTAHAQGPWRTPPIKNTGNTETVSCDLLNASGQDISVSNIVIRVQTLEGDASRLVVDVPGPFVIADGRGIRGSSPVGVLPIRTVYCELDPGTSISTGEENLLFTMTFDDATRKAVTTARPRTKTGMVLKCCIAPSFWPGDYPIGPQ